MCRLLFVFAYTLYFVTHFSQNNNLFENAQQLCPIQPVMFSNQNASDILTANTDFIDEIGLKEHLSPTRANGLVSMIKQMKFYALAFQAK